MCCWMGFDGCLKGLIYQADGNCDIGMQTRGLIMEKEEHVRGRERIFAQGVANVFLSTPPESRM